MLFIETSIRRIIVKVILTLSKKSGVNVDEKDIEFWLTDEYVDVELAKIELLKSHMTWPSVIHSTHFWRTLAAVSTLWRHQSRDRCDVIDDAIKVATHGSQGRHYCYSYNFFNHNPYPMDFGDYLFHECII